MTSGAPAESEPIASAPLHRAWLAANTLVRVFSVVLSARSASKLEIVRAPAAPLAKPTPPRKLANTSQGTSRVVAKIAKLAIGSSVPARRKRRRAQRSGGTPLNATSSADIAPDAV